MYLNSAKDCKFINNSAVRGGAMFNSHALSSNFTGNTAHEGGAICDGSAQSCQFRYNSATNGGAMAGVLLKVLHLLVLFKQHCQRIWWGYICHFCNQMLL